MNASPGLAFLALIWGGLSALSLPLGALLGLWTKPSQKLSSSLMAFGAGALLFALTIELFAHSLHKSSENHDELIIVSTMAGALLGGLLFELLNRLLCSQGAFLRKESTLMDHVQKQKIKNAKAMIQSLSQIRFLQVLPAEDVVQLIPYVQTRNFEAGSIIFSQGEEGLELFFIVRGKVAVSRSNDLGQTGQLELSAGETFGELALISDKPRTATITALDEVHTYVIQKTDFEYLLSRLPSMKEASRQLVSERLQSISGRDESFVQLAQDWEETAQKNLQRLSLPVTSKDMEVNVNDYKGGAAKAIWLGIALDAIPESLVIGMLVASSAASGSSMSFALIVGVFLANLPEAMSSAVTMQKQGTKSKTIIWMWLSLCLMTALGAMLGSLFFPAHPEGLMLYAVAAIEGLAAGAMLTMIANTMLPEAFEHGGSTVAGISTLIGFITALCVKILG